MMSDMKKKKTIILQTKYRKSALAKHLSYITEDKIEITNSFTYLEVKFSTNGTLLKKWSLCLGENQF